MKVLLASVFFFLFAPSGQAAPIEWAPVFQVTGTESVFTTGTLHSAVNTTTSGVVHTLSIPGVEDIPFQPVNGLLASTTGDTLFGGTVGNTTFDTILNSHSWQGGGGSFTIGGLTPGNLYTVQMFGVFDTRACCAARDTRYGDGLGNLSDNVTRGEGETALGVFVADAATQLIQVLPGDGGSGVDPALSAYVVRDATPIPEPATLSLAAVGGLALLLRRRLRRRRAAK